MMLKENPDFEEGFTDFEKAFNRLTCYRYYVRDVLKRDAAKLLELAKKELQKNKEI